MSLFDLHIICVACHYNIHIYIVQTVCSRFSIRLAQTTFIRIRLVLLQSNNQTNTYC